MFLSNLFNLIGITVSRMLKKTVPILIVVTPSSYVYIGRQSSSEKSNKFLSSVVGITDVLSLMI